MRMVLDSCATLGIWGLGGEVRGGGRGGEGDWGAEDDDACRGEMKGL